jgi:integrase
MRVLAPEEEKTYLLAASQPLRDIATLIPQTGMRPEEVYRIRRENVHLSQFYLFNPYGKTKAARRKIPLTEATAAILRKRLDSVKGTYLFPGRGVSDQPIIKVITRTPPLSNAAASVRSGYTTCATRGRRARRWLGLIS